MTDNETVSRFSGLPRAILLSISMLSGDTYRDVDGAELNDELSRRGFSPDRATLYGAMQALEKAGYVEASFAGAYSVDLIRLGHAGRQEVEGWPAVPGSLTATDVEQLVSVFEARGDDVDVPETERGRARAAAAALKDLGVSVTAELISTWLKHQGVG